jgi:hypothetical protein
MNKIIRITSKRLPLSESNVKRRPSDGLFKTSILLNPSKREELYAFAVEEGKEFYFTIWDGLLACKEATDDITLRVRLEQLYRGTLSITEVINHFHSEQLQDICTLLRNSSISRIELNQVLERLEHEVIFLLIHLHTSMPARPKRTSFDKILELCLSAHRTLRRTM